MIEREAERGSEGLGEVWRGMGGVGQRETGKRERVKSRRERR